MNATVESPLTPPQPFEEVAHTADLSMRVAGETKEIALARLVLALGQILSGGGPVAPRDEVTVSVEPGDFPVMAVDVLRELLYLFATEERVPAGCGVARFDESAGGEVRVWTSQYEEKLHGGGTDVKAVTFHAPRFEETESGGWVAEVTLDI